ncbi:MAG: hypothetical protein M1831_006964 [Alyxoria varia]|nr:MAG: hypothetical protein M1831_006964 [Alyxoria varia]
MSTGSARQKQSSKWGSLFSGAITGLESRLDNILAEDGNIAAQEARQLRQQTAESHRQVSGGAGLIRAPSTRSNARSTDGRSTSRTPAQSKPRQSTDSINSERISLQKDREPVKEEDGSRIDVLDKPIIVEPEGESTPEVSAKSPANLSDVSPRPSADISERSLGATEGDHDNDALPESAAATKTAEELLSELSQAQDANESLELRRQEEVHAYLERIDALQAKLQYLAKEVTSSARQIESEASDESWEKKIAEKDEKIVALMEEGQKLSKTEVSQTGTIRNLRAKNAEDARSLTEMRRKLARTETSHAELKGEVARVESERKDNQTKITRLSRFEREVLTLRKEVTTRESTIEQLQLQLSEAVQQAEDSQRESHARELEKERELTQSLRDEARKLRAEQQTKEEKTSVGIRKAQEELTREKERNNGAEAGLRNELMLVESRLEALRERSEEASTGSTSDAQTKLMRQVETLQTQYSMASENWHGIEASLQARVTALEKERDDSARHESEARKKAREIGSSSRKFQEQLEETTHRCRIFEQDLTEQKTQAEKVQSRAAAFEKALQDARAEFERERRSLKADFAARLEEEKSKLSIQIPQQHHMTDPSAFPNPHPQMQRKISGYDVPTLRSRKNTDRKTSELGLPNAGRPQSRRASNLYFRGSEAFSPNGHEGSPPIHTPQNGHNQTIRTPSIHTADQEEPPFENGSSPRRTVNDMLSASTAAAGPSVQLVERMSSNVRRLESEKAASKDELARLSAQRDEARKEVVSLMQEVEEKRALDQKVEHLEQEMSTVSERYQTTLEMLGERSERVGELEADVADLKKIYRELLDSTMK